MKMPHPTLLALRRVVDAGRKGVTPTAEDLNTLAEAYARMTNGERPDKVFGAVRAEAGRPRDDRYTLEDIERIMAVVELKQQEPGLSDRRARERALGLEDTETLRKMHVRLRKLAEYFLEDERIPDPPSGPRPEAATDFADDR